MTLNDNELLKVAYMLIDDRDKNVPEALEAHKWWLKDSGNATQSAAALLERDTPYVQSLKVRIVACLLEGVPIE